MLTKVNWINIEYMLTKMMRGVNLRMDGYAVSLMPVVDNMRIKIAVLVDGKFKAEWLRSEIGQKFYQHHVKYMGTAWIKKQDRKLWSKSQLNELKKEILHDWYDPAWTSFKLMRTHFMKTCSSIEFFVPTAEEIDAANKGPVNDDTNNSPSSSSLHPQEQSCAGPL